MTERVFSHCALVCLADIFSVSGLDTLGYRYRYDLFTRTRLIDLIDKVIVIENRLGQTDDIGTRAVLRTRQSCRTGEPARVTAHDLNYINRLVRISVRVADYLLHCRGNVLRRAAVPRSVVGHREVIVNRLGNADKRNVAFDNIGIFRQFVNGIH